MSFLKQVNILFSVYYVLLILLYFESKSPFYSLLGGLGKVTIYIAPILYIMSVIFISIYAFGEKQLKKIGCQKRTAVKLISVGIATICLTIIFYPQEGSEHAIDLIIQDFRIGIFIFTIAVLPSIIASMLRLYQPNLKKDLGDDILDSNLK